MKDLWLHSAALFAGHWREALLQGLVFVLGSVSAVIVLRHRLHFLMDFPVWMARKLLQFLSGDPGFLKVFATIFCFNTVAIFCYMMTGALDPLVPTAIGFLTGMNIAIVAALMPALTVGAGMGWPDQATPSRLEVVCFLLTLCLELPVFWASIAMGSTMAPVWGGEARASLGPILPRVIAYWLVSAPLLCLSAAVEATGIRAGLRRHPPRGPVETPPDRSQDA